MLCSSPDEGAGGCVVERGAVRALGSCTREVPRAEPRGQVSLPH